MWRARFKRTVASLLVTMLLVSEGSQVYATNSISGVDIDNGQTYGTYNIDNYDEEVSQNSEDGGCEHNWVEDTLEWVPLEEDYTYKFVYNEDTGEYKSNNVGKENTNAIRTFEFDAPNDMEYTFEYNIDCYTSQDKMNIKLNDVYVLNATTGIVKGSLTVNLVEGKNKLVVTYFNGPFSGTWYKGSDTGAVKLPSVRTGGTCSECGESHIHEYEDIFETEITCKADGYGKKVCTICDAIFYEGVYKTPGHLVNGDELREGYGSYMKNASVVVEATCTEDAKYTYECDNCDYSVTTNRYKNESDYWSYTYSLGHTKEGGTLVRSVSKEETCDYVFDVYSCGRCEEEFNVYGSYAGCNYVGEITTEPTCSEQGIKTYTCTKCGSNYTNKVDTIPHTYGEQGYIEYCDKRGGGYEDCEICGYRNWLTYVSAKGHDYVREIVEEKTVTEDGLARYTCSRCEDTYDEVIPASALCAYPEELDGDMPYDIFFKSFSSGSAYGDVFAIDKDGNIWGWGYQDYNKFLTKGTEFESKYKLDSPRQLTEGVNFTKVVSNNYNVYALTEDGEVYRWGAKYNYGNFLTNDSTNNNGSYATVPEKYESDIKFKDIHTSYGNSYMVALLSEDGDIYISGQGSGVQAMFLGTTGYTNYYMEKLNAGETKFDSISTGYDFVVAKTTDGDIWAGGGSYPYYPGYTVSGPIFAKREIGITAKGIGTSEYNTYIIDENGDIYGAGSSSNYMMGTDSSNGYITDLTLIASGLNAVKIDGEYYVTSVLTEDGKVYSIGYNYYDYFPEYKSSNNYDFRKCELSKYVSTEYKIVDMYVNYNGTYMIDEAGNSHCYGSYTYGFPDKDGFNYSSTDGVKQIGYVIHNFNEISDGKVEPTCYDKGLQYLICADCGIKVSVVVDALGHDCIHTKSDRDYVNFTYTHTVTCSRCEFELVHENQSMFLNSDNGGIIVNACDEKMKVAGYNYNGYDFACDTSEYNNAEENNYNIGELTEVEYEIPMKKIINTGYAVVGLGYDGNIYTWGNFYNSSSDASASLKPKDTSGFNEDMYTYTKTYEPRLYDNAHVYEDIISFGGRGCIFKDIDGNYYVSGYFNGDLVKSSNSSYYTTFNMEPIFVGYEFKDIAYTSMSNACFITLDSEGRAGIWEKGAYTSYTGVEDIRFSKLIPYGTGSVVALAENGDLYFWGTSNVIGYSPSKEPGILISGTNYNDIIKLSEYAFICRDGEDFYYFDTYNDTGKLIESSHGKIKEFVEYDTNTSSYDNSFMIKEDGTIYSIKSYNSNELDNSLNIDMRLLGSVHDGNEAILVDTVERTCYSPAVNYYKCSNCENEYSVAYGGFGHEWEFYETIVERQFGVFGEYIYKCKGCGETKEENSIEYDTLNISDWQYVVDNQRNVVSLVDYIGSNPNVEVHDYYYVAANEKWYYTELNNGNSSTFYDNDFIESVTISGNTLAAGESMERLFYDCDNLVTVDGMPGNSKIMDYAFNGCDNLVSATGLPQEATSMVATFQDCIKLEKMEDLPRTVTGDGLGVTFRRCVSLREIGEIPLDMPINTMSSTFYECTSLENCPNIPLSVYSASSTFYGCTSLKNMCEIGPDLYEMDKTFYGCTNMEVDDLRLNDGNQMLTATFAHCDKIKRVSRLPRPQEIINYTYNAEKSMYEYNAYNGIIYRTRTWQLYETFLDCDGIEEIDIRAGIEGIQSNCNDTTIYYRGIFADCDNIKDIHVGYVGDRRIFSKRYQSYSSSAGVQNTALRDMLGSFMVLTEEEFRAYQSGNSESKIQEYAQTRVALNKEDVTIYYDDTLSELEASYIIGYARDYDRYTPFGTNSYTQPGQFKYENPSTTDVTYRWTILLPLGYDTVRKYNIVCEKEKEYDENGVCNNFYEGYNNNLSDWEYTSSSSYKRVYLNRYKGIDDTLNIPATIKVGEEEYDVVPMKNFLQDALVSELYFDPELKYPEVVPSITGYSNTEDDGTNQIRSLPRKISTLQYNSQPYKFYASYDIQSKDILEEDYIRTGNYLVLGPFIKKVGYIPNGVNVVVNESQYLESDLYLPASCISFDDRKYTMYRDSTTTYGEFMSYNSQLEVTNDLDINVYYSCSAADYESQLIANSKHEGYTPQKAHRDTDYDDLCDDCMCLLTLEDWDNHVNLEDKSITLTRYLGDSTSVTVPSKIDVKGEDFSTIMDASYYTFTDTVAEEVAISDGVEFSGLESSSVIIDSWLEDTYGYPSITYADESVHYYKNFNTFKRSNIKKLVLGNTNVTNFSRLFFEDTTPIESITLPDNLQIADFMFFTGWQTGIPGTKDSTNDYLKEVVYNGTQVSSLRATFAGCTQLSSVTDFADCTDIRNMDDTFYGCLSLKSVSDNFLPERAENLSKLEGTFRLSGLTGFGGRIPYGVKTLISTFHGTKSFGEFTATIPNTVVTMQSTFTDSTIKKAVSVPNSVTNMKLCYHNCDSITDVDTKEIDMDSVIEMTGTFLDCDALVTADLSGCTSAENMSAIFGSSMRSEDMYGKEYTGYVYKRYNWYYESDGSKSLKTVVLPTGTTLKRLDCAFAGCTALTSVSDIPDGVYDIDNAFWGCTSLQKVKMSEDNDSLYMMRYAFYNSGVTELEIYTSSVNATNPFAETFTKCNKLKKLTLNIKHLTTLKGLGKSSSVEEIYFYSDDLRNIDEAFIGWTSLRVTSPIPYGITSMVKTFENCDSLEECPSIPDTVINMSNCFYDCDSLTECPEIGDNVQNMNYAFYHCDNLTTAIIGKNAQNNESAFGYCKNDLEVSPIPGTIKKLYRTFNYSGITELPEMEEGIEELVETFAYCASLEIGDDDKIPDSVTTLDSTFKQCSNITRAPKIGNNITNMGGTFERCSKLVEIPWESEQLSNITIMTRAFSECESLNEFDFDIANADRADYAFEHCTSLTKVGAINAKNMQSTFSYCSSLEEVEDIGDAVENLTATFYECTKLNADIDISGAKNLALLTNAFYKCSSLVNQPILPEDGKIDTMSSTFCYCSKLKNAQIPATVTSLISTYAYCYSLESIDKFPENLTTIGVSDPTSINVIGEVDNDDKTFMGNYNRRYETNKGYLGASQDYYFDDELYSDYDAVAAELNKSISERNIYYHKEHEHGGAFRECTSLKSAPEFPDSLKNISYGFYGCTSLERVDGDTTKDIYYATCAFMDCTKLKKAKLNILYRADFAFANCKSLEDGPDYIGGINQEFACYNCEKLNKMPLIDISYNSSAGASGWLSYTVRMPYSFYNCKGAKGAIEFKVDTVTKRNIEYRPILYKTFTNCESTSGVLDMSWDVDCKTLSTWYYGFYGDTVSYENNMPMVDTFRNSGIEKAILGDIIIEEDINAFADCKNLKAIEITKQFKGNGNSTDLLGFTYKNDLREMVWDDDIRGYKPTSVDTEFLGYLNMDSWNAVGRTLGGCDDKAGYDLKFDEGLDAKATFEIVGKNATAVWYELDELADITNKVTTYTTVKSGEKSYFDLNINTSGCVASVEKPCIFLVDIELKDPENYAVFNDTNRYSLQVGYESQTFGFSYVANNESVASLHTLHIVKKNGDIPSVVNINNISDIVEIKKVYYAPIKMTTDKVVPSTNKIVDITADEVDGSETASVGNIANNSLATIGTYNLATAGTGGATSDDYDMLETTIEFKNLSLDQDDTYYLCYITTNDGAFQTFANPVKLNVNDVIDHLVAEYKGDPVAYGTDYSKDDVEVKAYYSSETVDENGEDLGVVIPSEYWDIKDGSATMVESEADGESKISDIAVFEEAEASYKVPGYKKVDHMKAVYTGPDIGVGSSYDKDDVTVTLYYDEEETESKELTSSEWTVKDESLQVKAEDLTEDMSIIDIAVYNDTYNKDVEAEYEVPAYLVIDHMKAEYKGPEIPYGSEYNKDDVEVTVYFDANEEESLIIASDKWTVEDDDLLVKSDEADDTGKISDVAVYKDDHQEKKAGYNVQGYKKIDHMTAEYAGPIIPIGEEYDKDDVTVTLYYDEEETDSKVLTSSEWTESSLNVILIGDNEYTATYTDDYQSKSADYYVTGYKKIDHMKAEYKGEPIPYGEEYAKEDVEVTIYFDAEENESQVLGVDDWSVEDGSLIVEEDDADIEGKILDNAIYTDEYQTKEAEYSVQGYKKIDHMKAEYKGEPIPVGTQYNKEDVEVTLYYDAEETDSKVLEAEEWTERSLDVTIVGDNEYTATYTDSYQTKEADYVVDGYKKIDHMSAEYTGEPIPVGEEYSKEEVVVTIYFNAEETDKKILEEDEWTESSLEVTQVGDNEYTATYTDSYQSKSADYIVDGYKKVDHMTAEYKGEAIPYGTEYSKDDVEVTLYFDAEETDKRVLASNEWNVKDSDLNVTEEDADADGKITDIAVYTDNYQSSEAEYKVQGYKKIDHMKAEYTGEPIPVGNEYNKEEVIVTLYFDAEETDSKVLEKDEWTESGLEVNVVGDNTYTATYMDTYQSKSADYIVDGYKKIDHMKAEYKGEPIPYGSSYDKGEVEVTVYYDAEENDKRVLTVDEWSVKDNDLVVKEDEANYSGKVLDIAVYTDDYQSKEAEYNVQGYKRVDHMTATYDGPAIPIGEQYDKDDVTVTLYYDAEETDSKVLISSEWTESGLDVNNIGDNNFTATYTDVYQSSTAGYEVPGYKKVDHMTAEYKGEEIPYGNSYSKSEVEVTLYYDAEETDKKVLTVEEWSVKDGDLTVYENEADASGKIKDIAVYTDSYQSKEAEYNVQGYKKVDHMVAEYKGPAVPIGEQYDKDDVEVTLYYNTEETEKKVLDSSEWSESGLDVTLVGDNGYTATYTDNYQTCDDNYSVTGYKKVDHINAEYIGPFVPMGTEYDKDNVTVKVYYGTDEENSESEVLTSEQWVESSLLVENIGTNNEYTATYRTQYQELTDTYNVEGYKHIHHIKAEYDGPDIEIGESYDKEDVKVTLCYNEEESEVEVVDNEDWSIRDNSTEISIVGDNEDVAEYSTKYQELEDTYIVPGINPIPIVDHITAEYKGPDIQIVGAYLKKDVEVKVYYTNYPNIDTLGESDWSESNLQVTQVGDNEYTATYKGKTAEYTVVGKDEITGIEAEYTGAPIEIGNQYNKDEVNVSEVYASGNKVRIDSSDWTESSLEVSHVGSNEYTATYNGMTDTYTVDGIDFVIGIKADYVGEDIPVKEEYNKDKVEVYLLFNEDEPYKLNSNQWTESGLVVENIGSNEYTATYENFTDGYTVTGIDHVKAIEAEYTGDDINVGDEYNKDEVEVYMIFYEKEKEKVNTSDWRESSLKVSKVGKNEYTATYDGFRDSYEVTGLDHVKDIEAEYKGEPVQVKEEYNKDDVEVFLVYYEKEPEKINSEQWTTSSLSVNSIGENKYTATYEEFTDEYTVTGFDEVDKIEAEYTGDPVKINDSYDKKDVVVVVTYKSGDTKTLTDDEWTESGLKVDKVGENEYTATYKEVTDTYTVIGLDRVKKIEADYNGEPVQVKEEYDKDDVEVTAYYYEKDKEVLDSDDWTASSLIVTARGDNEFTATYEDVKDDYIVPGVDEEVGIEAEYKGEPVPIGEKYNKKDVTVNLVYESGNKEVIDTSEWTESSLEVTEEGENDYTATYKEFEDDYTVVGFDDTIVAVSIKGTYPDKVLVGEEFIEDKADIEVTYSDGSKQKLAYEYLDKKPKSKVVTKIGTNEYDIGYKGASGILKVTGYDIDGISAKYEGPDIPVGEDYNKDDVTVTVKFTDGTEQKLDSDEFKTSSLTVTKKGPNMYTATWNGFKCEFEVIGVSSEPKEKIVNDNGPKTGDNSMVMLAILLMMICVIKLLSILKRGRAVE